MSKPVLTEIGSVHVATLHDALQRASKIAPTKGAAWDRAQGIHLTFGEGFIEVRSTNTEMTYFQRVDAEVAVMGTYRMPSTILPSFVASMPMVKDTDRCRFLIDEASPSKVTVQYGKSKLKASVKLIVGSYPEFGPIKLEGMTPAQELASSVEAVTWACDDSGKLAGVLINGEDLIALDGKVAARINCEVSTEAPIVALLSPLVPLLKLGTNIHIKGVENKLVIALDDTTQITTTLILEPFPDIIDRMRAIELPDSFQVNRQRLIDGLSRLTTFIKSSDRLPVCELRISQDLCEVGLTSDSGEVQDACVITDQTMSQDKTFKFNPNRLIQALESFKSSTVTIRYTPELPTRKPVHIANPSGEYEVWVIPMADTAS